MTSSSCSAASRKGIVHDNNILFKFCSDKEEPEGAACAWGAHCNVDGLMQSCRGMFVFGDDPPRSALAVVYCCLLATQLGIPT